MWFIWKQLLIQKKLYGEKDSKYDIENIKELSVLLELIVEFHGNTESIDQNHGRLVHGVEI